MLCISYFQEKSIEHGHPTSATLRPTSEYDIKHMAHLILNPILKRNLKFFKRKRLRMVPDMSYLISHANRRDVDNANLASGYDMF